jgi:hypothetical protein
LAYFSRRLARPADLLRLLQIHPHAVREIDGKDLAGGEVRDRAGGLVKLDDRVLAANARRTARLGPFRDHGKAGDGTVLEAYAAVLEDLRLVRREDQALALAFDLDAESFHINARERLAELVFEGGVDAFPFAFEFDLEEGRPTPSSSQFIHTAVEGQCVALKLVRDLEVVLVR